MTTYTGFHNCTPAFSETFPGDSESVFASRLRLREIELGHDTQIGEYCQLSPLVDIMGNVKIGARCFFGGSSVVIPHVTIGDDCTIGAGAVVIRDVPSGSKVVGNPGRIIG